MRRMLKCFMLLFAVIFLLTAGLVWNLPSVSARDTAVDEDADAVLKAMSEYLAGITAFEIQTHNMTEVVLRSGQKIQFDTPANFTLQRPDKFRAERIGAQKDQILYYDGKSLTLMMIDKNLYASVPAPDTIEDAIDFARTSLDIVAPAGDLVCKNAYDILMEDVVAGFYIGKSYINGSLCHHLAFRGYDVDWQIWIEQGNSPLPRKFVITSKWITGAPQFTVNINAWNLSPKITDETFNFVPPEGAKKIDFIGHSPNSGSRK